LFGLRVSQVSFEIWDAMASNPTVIVAIALLLLLLRMINFVAGHGHHRL
jgi:hypothetical protein